jgi:hypothetical protein
MSLSILLLSSGILGLLLGLRLAIFQVDRTDKKRAKTIIILSSAVCLVGAGNQIITSISEAERGRAAQKQEAEQRKRSETLLGEVRALTAVALKSFSELEQSLERLPAGTRAALQEDARQVQHNLSILIDAASRSEPDLATLEQLKVSIKGTQAAVQNLSTVIEKHRVEDATNGSAVRREPPPIERPPARDTPTGRTENPQSSPPVTEARVASPTPMSAAIPFRQEPSTQAGDPFPDLGRARCAIEIIAPKKDETVAIKTQIKGSANVPAGMYLWVFVRKAGLTDWWPQGGGHADIGKLPNWAIDSYFGEEKDDGGALFEITAAIIDRAGDYKLSAYVAEIHMDDPPLSRGWLHRDQPQAVAATTEKTENRVQYPGTSIPPLGERGCALEVAVRRK